jgi:hypothetical protein
MRSPFRRYVEKLIEAERKKAAKQCVGRGAAFAEQRSTGPVGERTERGVVVPGRDVRLANCCNIWSLGPQTVLRFRLAS